MTGLAQRNAGENDLRHAEMKAETGRSDAVRDLVPGTDIFEAHAADRLDQCIAFGLGEFGDPADRAMGFGQKQEAQHGRGDGVNPDQRLGVECRMFAPALLLGANGEIGRAETELLRRTPSIVDVDPRITTRERGGQEGIRRRAEDDPTLRGKPELVDDPADPFEAVTPIHVSCPDSRSAPAPVP